jgi:glycosyltransferase involved in cell wall biosynthesis
MQKKINASIILLAYNQQQFIKEALISLVNQDLDNLEIVISDDSSTDNTWTIINDFYRNFKGNKKLIINRNHENIGVIGNFTKAVSLSSGDVIFIAHGDDLSMQNRCSRCLEEWDKFGNVPDLMATDAYDMKISGEIIGIKKTDDLQKWDIDKWINSRPYIFGASHMVTKRLLQIGNLDLRLPFEDQCLLFRSLLMGGAVRVSLPLIKHRQGGISQQRKNYSYHIKIERLIRSSLDTEFESNQMLNDAIILKGPTKVFARLYENQEIALYKNRMFNARKLSEKKKIFLDSYQISLVKKFRYFQLSSLSYFHRAIMRFNELIGR